MARIDGDFVVLIVGKRINKPRKIHIWWSMLDGRRGCIRVGFEALENDQLQLSVEDDGVGFADRSQRGGGLGQELVKGLAHELGGHLEVKSSERGSAFVLRMPYVNPVRPAAPRSTLIH